MKLLYVHNTALDSQKSNMIQVLYMCDAFHRLGVDITLALPGKSNGMTEAEVRKEVEAKIGRINEYRIVTFKKMMVAGRLQAVGGYLGARKLMRRSRTDVCFVRSPQFLRLAITAGLPTIFESHNSVLHNKYRFLDDFWRDKLLSAVRSENLLQFVSISKALTDFWLRQGVPEKKCLSLHDGIDGDSFASVSSKQTARRQLNIELSRKVVLYAGSLYEDRGIENIIRLAECLPDVRFIVVGGPPARRRYLEEMSRARAVDNISFPGWVPRDRVKVYLAAADVLLLLLTRKVPTIDFCSPLKMFEYMAAGRVIVAQAFPTLCEVLEHRKNAFLAEPENYDSLLQNVREALATNEGARIAGCARKLVLREFTWLSRARTILDALNKPSFTKLAA